MNRRRVRPYKILAVALGAGASLACNNATPSAQQTDPGSAPSAAPPPADDAVERQLLLLRSELALTTPAEIMTKQAHFRPLCDKDGYPLVGNVARKAAPPEGEDALAAPSGFCAALRAKKPA